MDINLIDKLSLENLEELEDRDKNFRIVINHKIYDTSHEDDLARFVINGTKFKDMLLIRFEYYLSKTYHGLGRGDMVFYDKLNDKLYVIELKSLKDKYSSTTDGEKIEKCIAQSTKYSEYTLTWGLKESTPVSVIELEDGKIQIIERTTLPAQTQPPQPSSPEKISEKTSLPSSPNLQPTTQPTTQPILKNVPKVKLNPWTNTLQKREQEEINSDHWFTHPGDQTMTRYKIVGDTLESERIVDTQPSSKSRRSFRKRVKKICQECTKCTKYFLTMKDIQGNVLLAEMHDINEIESID